MNPDTDLAPLVFADDVGRVKVTVDALAAMLAHRQVEETATEAGGLLVGRRIVDTEDVVVDWVTEPLPTDRRSRFRLHRSESHFEAVHRAWEDSGGRVDYLGEWHTHAEPDPTPSEGGPRVARTKAGGVPNPFAGLGHASRVVLPAHGS